MCFPEAARQAGPWTFATSCISAPERAAPIQQNHRRPMQDAYPVDVLTQELSSENPLLEVLIPGSAKATGATFTGPLPNEDSMPTLSDEIKTFIVQGLACFDTPSEVADAVKA